MTDAVVDHRSALGAFRRLAVPEAAASAADQLLGIVDTIVVGTLGTNALAAITGASTAFFVVLVTLFGFQAGLRILGAQAVGARDFSRFGSVVRSSGAVSLAVAVVAALASLAVGPALMRLLVGPLPSLEAGTNYFVLRCISLVPIAITAACIAAFGAAGDTRLSFRVLVAINLVHVPLVVILSLGSFTHHPFGLVGAALSSLIAECIGAGYVLWMVSRRRDLQIFERFDIDWNLARRTTRLSLPEVVFLAFVMIPDATIVGMLAPLGAQTLASYRALVIVSDLTFAVPYSLGNATEIVLGQRLGARDAAGARDFYRRALRLGVLASSLVGIAVAVLGWPLAALFTLDPKLASLAALPLAVHMLTLPLKGWALEMIAPIRASGDTRFTMFVGVATSALVIPIAYVAIERFHAGLYAIALGWITAWGVRCGMTVVRLRQADWAARESLVPA